MAHGGQSVSRAEAELAFDVHTHLVRDIERRRLLKKTVFPRTAVFVFGAEGLRQRGRLSNSMRDHIRAWQAAEEDWTFWLPYDARQVSCPYLTSSWFCGFA